MARIRSIKPEFPQSESMGRISRDARLLFIQLWTLCDDEGRARASSRMLASLLYPYDDDAPSAIDGWLKELETEKCVIRYQIRSYTYLQVCNWSTHQKIDHPSKSKIPPPTADVENIREVLRSSREASSEDQGREGIKEGIGEKISPSASLQAHSSAKAEELVDNLELTSEPITKVNGSIPTCPFEAIAEAYHQELPELPSIVVLSPNRKRTLQARWREVCASDHLDRDAGLTFFRDFFKRIRQSQFLLGKTPPKRPGERSFRADFDWIFNAANFVKIVEGRYHQRQH